MQDQSARTGLWKALPPAVRAAFVCCFAAGFLAHLFAFTNLIPNSDGLSRVFDAQQMTISGRWFLHYASMWNGFVQAPAVIGFFALLFLSLAAGLVASMLKLKSPLLGGLIGALMSVFPSVAYTFLYLFTASAYCFGLLLAVLAVWLTQRFRFGFLFAAPLLACAVGTYQAYLAAAAALALICVIFSALEEGKRVREIVLTGLRQLGLLALGLGLYWLILQIFLNLKDLTLLNYKGIGSFGESFSLGTLPGMIAAAYKDCFEYFFVPHGVSNYTTPVAAAANGLLALVGLWAFVRLLRRGVFAKRPGALGLTLALSLLLPLALNLTVLMDKPMPIMRYALVFAYVLALALADRALAAPVRPAGRGGKKQSGPARRSAALRWAAACAAALSLIVSFNIINLAYTVSAQAHRATESFAARLVERVESAPGYEQGMPVIVIGGFPSRIYHNDVEAFALVEDYSNLSSSVMPLNKHVYYYLNDWLNVPWAEPDEKTMKAVSASAEFQAMPLYPSDGSVVISDGRVIVKLASRYTPKQPYEIAYENRK